MLLWETHMCTLKWESTVWNMSKYCSKLDQCLFCYSEMGRTSLEYIKVLIKDRTVYIFSQEALLWMIITFFWQGKSFMRCFCENCTCYSKMRSCYLGYVTLLLEDSTVFIFSVGALHWNINTFIWKGNYFLKCFCEKHTCVNLKWEVTVWYMSTYCSMLEQCTF